MKYRQIARYTGDLIETILNGRGIDNINLFLNPNSSNDTKLDMITNVDKGIDLIKNSISKKILILVDSDMDGFSSAAIIYQYLKFINRYIDIDYYVHEKKEHGLTNSVMEYITNKNFDLIIVPDAGSNDIEQMEYIETVLKSKVLVIDHHEIEVRGDYGVIINNQDCEYTNKNLTGVGLSYVFCKALEKHFRTGELENLSDLALIGLVGDSSDLRDNEVRNICFNALGNIQSNLIRTFYEIADKDYTKLRIRDLSFGGIIPMVNAITRVGTLEERQLLFEALTDIDNTRMYHLVKKKKNKETGKFDKLDVFMDLYQYVVDIGQATKRRQDKLAKEHANKLEEQYNPIAGIQIYITPEDLTGMTGLIATKLSEKYQKPTIILKKRPDGIYSGSIRGNIEVFDDFKAWCIDTGLFEMVMGHSNAAGCEITEENLSKLRELALDVEPREIWYDVDMIYKGNMDIDDIKLVDKYSYLWYGGVKPPMFAVEQIKIPKSWLQYSKSTIRFYLNGVSYVKFKSSEEEYKQLIYDGFDDNIILNVVGQTDINRWSGKETPQFIIEDYEIVKEEPNIYGIFA